ncbi:ASI1-immunoprecipitated protein 1-like [Tasmannia lanceolata]|uniref:ASI1-immunoprecipitated protein 1-like n=1 Tax=Tasmannia lanceolata TaxID=3420 RepID=UPI004062C477
MGTPALKEYAEFAEKMRRTVYLDNLSPQVTVAILKTALGQFGNVTNVQFIPKYVESRDNSQCALVEMETSNQAESMVADTLKYPFMVSGMPRPVRARPAKMEMFADHPPRPGGKIHCRWVEPEDPEFKVANKLKYLTRKHAAEASLLLKLQMDEEEKLAKQQGETLKAEYKKLDMIESVVADGSVNRLARHYKVNLTDD